MKTNRKADFPILPVILHRWSPRAMSGEEISHEELMTLFEAARWAPSSYNGQPWRFLYATRNSSHFKTFFDLLMEGNQKMVQKCGRSSGDYFQKNIRRKWQIRTHS